MNAETTRVKAITVYGLKTCDRCRKARKALESTGFDVRFQDLRDAPPSRSQISNWLDLFGEALVNRRSTTWRGLDEATRDRPALDLLLDHPTLMKRPVIVGDDETYLGWDKVVQSALTA